MNLVCIFLYFAYFFAEKLNQVDNNGRHMYVILEGEATFAECRLPIVEAYKFLTLSNFTLSPEQRKLPFCDVLEKFGMCCVFTYDCREISFRCKM